MKLVISVVFLFISFIASAQWGSLNFSIGLPQNEFKENTDAMGIGADLSFGIPFQKGIPVYFGLDFNYLVYGTSRNQETLEAQVTLSDGTPIGDPIIIPLEMVNTNSIFGTHALIRAQAPLSNIKPYVEGLLGFRYIYTNSKILDLSDQGRYSGNGTDVISNRTVLDDWVFSYGYGGGFMIKVIPHVFIDIRADFLKGRQAEYFDADDTSAWSIVFAGDVSNFDEETVSGENLDFSATAKRSTTDLLVIKLGLGLMF